MKAVGAARIEIELLEVEIDPGHRLQIVECDHVVHGRAQLHLKFVVVHVDPDLAARQIRNVGAHVTQFRQDARVEILLDRQNLRLTWLDLHPETRPQQDPWSHRRRPGDQPESGWHARYSRDTQRISHVADFDPERLTGAFDLLLNAREDLVDVLAGVCHLDCVLDDLDAGIFEILTVFGQCRNTPVIQQLELAPFVWSIGAACNSSRELVVVVRGLLSSGLMPAISCNERYIASLFSVAVAASSPIVFREIGHLQIAWREFRNGSTRVLEPSPLTVEPDECFHSSFG